MSNDYFSDRERGPRPRTEEVISPTAWGGIAATIESLVSDGSFGESFPETCQDGGAIVGTDFQRWHKVMQAEVGELPWPLSNCAPPPILTILDLVEFSYRHVSKATPIPGGYHSYFKHNHLSFDRAAGRMEYRANIERLFARNGLAYELTETGQVRRLGPPVLRDTLAEAAFRTGDAALDEMLEAGRSKFLSPGPKIRRESLEKLWDAWERLKTIEPGGDKKAQVKALLDKAAAEASFRDLLETEAKALTDIGNKFMIRHSETNRTPIHSDAHVDYLFHRLFSLIWMILKTRRAAGIT